MRNFEKDPREWDPDIKRSISEFNEWFRTTAPREYANARLFTCDVVAEAFNTTRNFAGLDAPLLRESPALLQVARQACAPPLARDRLAALAEVDRAAVKSIEDGRIPSKITDADLSSIATTINVMLDPELFTWIAIGTMPTKRERDKAIDVISDRVTLAVANPVIRNSQEKRQIKRMEKFLASQPADYQETSAPNDAMPPGSYAFRRNVPLKNEDGSETKLPVDCVLRTHGDGPLLCIEMKSAGDETNVNKRRKEEASKHDGLKKTYGDSATMLLQLFGHFNTSYLQYEARAGLDWFWDHRIDDLAEYL